MDVVPVIDVRHGVAVAAARGDRASYKPLATPLAGGSDPVAIARGYADLFTFPILYVADLDGIEGRGRNAALPDALAAALPGVQLWIDGGAKPRDAAERFATGRDVMPVIGSESMEGDADLVALRRLARDHHVLSLDFREQGFVGPRAVLDEPQHWPDKIIVMTLARVGAGEGPDLDRIGDVVARANGRHVYAAGGVRHRADIEALHRAGAAGVLVATALHAGKVKAGDLLEIAGL